MCQTATTCTTANQTVWTYDKNGNRATEKAGAAAQSVYTYDTTDQLTAISGPGAKSFSYNANGDQVTAGADTATFNTARQTIGATVGGVATTFAYDGNGNRHTITTGGIATTELWDMVGGLPNLAIERSGAGVVQRRYTYGRGTETLGYTDPAAGSQGWYMTDALGSAANITNSSGVAVATYTYNPLGTQRVNTTTPGFVANPLKYTGQHLDPTGNYNLRARQYNPSLGRFTQTDPMPYGAGSMFESSYAYGRNNPGVFIDPSGLRSFSLPTNVIEENSPGELALVDEPAKKSNILGCVRKRADTSIGTLSVTVVNKGNQQFEILAAERTPCLDFTVDWKGTPKNPKGNKSDKASSATKAKGRPNYDVSSGHISTQPLQPGTLLEVHVRAFWRPDYWITIPSGPNSVKITKGSRWDYTCMVGK